MAEGQDGRRMAIPVWNKGRRPPEAGGQRAEVHGRAGASHEKEVA